MFLQRLQSVSLYYFLQIKLGLQDKGEVEGKCFCKNCNQGLVDLRRIQEICQYFKETIRLEE